ncbi:MAG: PKD-like domain-containing protein [Polaribacter sp.]
MFFFSGFSTSIKDNKTNTKSNNLNSSLLVVPTITSQPPATLNPTSGHAGTIVTITGTGFTNSSTVQFDGFDLDPANVNYISPTKIEITIPCDVNGTPLTSRQYDVDVDNSGTTIPFTFIAAEITTVFDANYELCIGESFTEIPLSAIPSSPSVGTVSYRWDNNNTSIGLAGSGTINSDPYEFPSFVAANATNEPISGTIQVFPIINGCESAPVTFDITVNPLPVIEAIGNLEFCAGETTTQIAFNSLSPNGGTDVTYTWTNSNTAIGLAPSGVGSPIPVFTATNSGTTAITSTITVTPEYRGCEGNPTDFTITVFPASDGGSLTAANSSICEGESTNLTLSGHVGNIIRWESSTDGFANITSIPNSTNSLSVSPNLDTAYRAVVQSNPSCNEAFSTLIDISVSPAVQAGAVSGGTSICFNTQSDPLTLTGNNGTVDRWQSSTDGGANWVDIPGTIGLTVYTSDFLTETTRFRAMVVSGSCTPTPSASTTVTVQPITTEGVLVVSGSSTICENSTVTLNFSSFSGTILGWEYNNTTLGSWTPVPNPTTAATYTSTTLTESTDFRVRLSSGVCPTIYSPEASVTVATAPAISDIPNQTICLNESRTFGDPPVPGYSYLWTSTSGWTSTLAQPTRTFSAAGGPETYTYRITDDTTGCFSEDTFQVTVDPLPAATVISDASICAGANIAIGAPSVPGSTYSWTAVPSYTWTPPGVSSTDSNPTVSPTVTTTFTLTETTANGCTTSNSVTITVEPEPGISFTGGTSRSICESDLDELIQANITGNYNTAIWEVVPAGAGTLAVLPSGTEVEFTPSATGIAAGSAIVRLTVTNTCNVALPPQDVNITIDRQSVADAGTALQVCGDSSITLDGTGSEFATSYSWSAPSGISGTLSPANTATPVYTPSAADIANANTLYPGGIPFTLVTNSGANCSPRTDTVLVTIIPPAEVDAGPATASICEGENLFLSGTADNINNSSISWDNNGGDGTFSNPNSLTPTYVPGINDIASGSVTLTLSADGNTPCLTATSDLILTIERDPVVDLGANITVCANETTPINLSPTVLSNSGFITWSTPNGNGSFNNANVANPIYTPAASDLGENIIFEITVDAVSPCAVQATDSVIYTINTIPTVDAGGDQTICETQGTYQLAGFQQNAGSTVWTTANGSGSFDNTIDNLNPIYTFSPADIARGSVTFTLTASQNTCTDVSDSVTITIQPNPTANAGTAVEICQGQSYVFTGSATNNSSVTWTRSGGSGTFVGDNTLNPTYTSSPSEPAGTIVFTLEAQPLTPCSSPVFSTVELVIVPNPTADAGDDANICEGEDFQITTANASFFSGSGGATGLIWTTSGDGTFTGGNTLTPTYNPGISDENNGSVVLSLTASNTDAPCFNNAVDQMTLTINRVPSINVLNPTIDVCTNAGVPVEITGVTAMDFDTLTWTSSSTGTSGFTPTNTPANTTDAIFYTPTAGDIATGSVVLTLEAARDPSNCNSSSTATVTLNFVEDVAVDAGVSPQTICEGTFYTTTSATVANASSVFWDSNGSGTWSNQNSINTAEYTPSAADFLAGSVTLTVTATGLAPCFDVVTDTIVLDLEPLPVITTMGSDSICETDSTYPITGTSITGNYETVNLSNWTSTGTGSFTSSGDPLKPIYNPTPADFASGSVTLTLTVDPVAPCAAPQSNTIVLDFIPEPVASAGGDFTNCETPFAITTATATAGTYASLEWTSSGTGVFSGGVSNIINPTYEPSAADITAGSVDLILKANPLSPCAVPYEETITVTLVELPVITVAPQSPICQDDTNVLVTGTSIINELSFVYTSTTGTIINNPTSLTPTVTPSATDITNGFITLTVEATPIASCGTTPVTETITIPVVRNPIVNAGPDADICEGETITTSSATQSFVDVAGGNLLWSNNGGGGTFLTPNDELVTTYQPGPIEIANGQVNLTLTGTATSPCATNATSTVTYNISGIPVVNVNPTIVTICENETYQVQPGQVDITNMSSVASVTWSATTPGTISQGGPLDLEPIYTPSATDIANGFTDLTIVVNPVTACAANPVTETIRVNISPLPTIDATQTSNNFCEGVNKQLEAIFTNEDPAKYNWQIISGTGSISNANVATPEYIPASDSDVVIIRVSVRGNAPCNDEVSQEITLTKTPTPEVILPATTATVCSSDTTFSLSGIVNNATVNTTYLWTRENPDGTGSFSNPTALNSTYTFSAADIANGSVTLRLTATSDATCALTDFEEIVITIDQEPTVTITNTITEICENETFAATATDTDASNYLWETVGASDGTFISGANMLNAVYEPGPNDILNGSFTIQITATGAATCTPAVATTTVSVIGLPEVDAGVEQRNSCASEPFQISGVTGSNYSSIQWTSTSGSPGSFSNDADLNPIYTPSATEIASGLPIVLQVEAFPNAGCSGSVTDTIVLNLEPEQTVNAGGPITICEDEVVSLNASIANTASVYWTTSSTTSTTDFSDPINATTTYTPSAIDIANGTVTLTIHAVSNSNCAEVVDDVVVTIINKPTANAGPPITICENSSYTLTGGEASVTNQNAILWTLTGGGSITPGTETTLTPEFVPSPGQTGNVTLTLTAFADPNCGYASDVSVNKTITIDPLPSVTVPASRTICQGESLVLTNTEVFASDFSSLQWTSSSGLGTFAPNNSAVTTYTPDPSQTGTVTLTLTATALNGTCSDVSENIVLTIEPSVTIEAGVGATICEDETYVVSGATINGGSGTFNWSIVGPASITPGTETTLSPEIVPKPGASGVVTVTLEANGPASCPGAVSDDVFITINPIPIIDAGSPIEACEGTTGIQLTGTGSNGVSYSWTHTGNGTLSATADPLQPIYNPSSADFANPSGITLVTLFLEATGATGCSNVVDSTTITLYADPTIFAGTDKEACEGATVSLNDATAANYDSVTWTTSGNGTFNYSTAGGVVRPTYTLGSADTGTITLTMIASPNSSCTNPDVTDEVVINVTQEPTITTTTNEITLCGETFTLPDLVTIANASDILWTNTTTVSNVSSIQNATSETPIITPTPEEIANGFIELTLTANPINPPCNSSATEIIRVNLAAAPTVSAGSDITVCYDTNPIPLNFGAAVLPSSTSYYWTTDGTGTILPGSVNSLQPQYTPGVNESGIVTFTLHGTNPSPCTGETTDTVTVDITPQPIANAGTDATICEGSSFNIVDADAQFGTTIQWIASSDVAGTLPATGSFNPVSADTENPTYTPSVDDINQGYVYLTMRVTNNCSISTDAMRLNITPGAVVFAGGNATICEGETYTLFDASSSATSVSWISSENSNGTSSSTYLPGSFTDPTAVNPEYIPSIDDINRGYVYLTITGSGNSSCAVDSSFMLLNIIKKPTVSATDISICASNTTGVALNGSGTNYDTLTWSVIDGPGSVDPTTGVFNSGLGPDILNNAVTRIRLVATPLSSCADNAVKEITVTTQALPSVEAGGDGAICYIPGTAIAPFTILGTNVSNASSTSWTTSGSLSGNFNLGTPVVYESFSNSCTPEVLTLTANGLGACSSESVSDSVTLTINCTIPSLGAITGLNTVCQGNSGVVYTVPVNSNVITYDWQVPTGATIVSRLGDNSIIVDYGANAVSGNVSVNGVNGCGSSPNSTLPITINELPTTGIVSGQQIVCAGSTHDYTTTIIPNADFYLWTLPDGSKTSTTTNSISIPFTALVTSGDLSVQGKNSCGLGASSAALPISVQSQPTLTSTLTPSICSDETFEYVPTSEFASTTYSWTRAVVSGISNTAGSGTGIISETLTNTSSVTIPVNYTITLTSQDGCTNSATITVDVHPIPTLTSSTPVAAICSGDSFNHTLTSNTTGNINWTRATVTGITEPGTSGANTISEVLTNVTTAPITVVYTALLPANSDGCTGDPITFNVVVNPEPNVDQPVDQVLCAGETLDVNFVTTNNGGVSGFTWTNDNASIGLPLTGSGPISGVTMTNTSSISQEAIIEVTPTFDNEGISCTGSPKTFTITINPAAQVDPIPSEVVCNAQSITPITFSTSNNSGTTTYSWTNDNTSIGLKADGTGDIAKFTALNTGSTPQIATITVTSTYTNAGETCSSTEVFTITVNPSPKATITGLNNFLVCENDTAPFITFEGSNGVAPYTFTYQINSDPIQQVTSSGTSNSATVSISTANSGSNVITLLSVSDSSTPTACVSTDITLPNEAFVDVQEQGTIIPQDSSTVSQVICENTSLTPIVYVIGGSATSAFVTGLPSGLISTFAPNLNTLTISGNPTSSGTFNYEVNTAGSTNGCNSSYGGSIVVNANDEITELTPTTINQELCSCDTLAPISYNLGGGATGGDVQFTPSIPAGITWSISSNILTISGASCDVGTFNYTVNSYGICSSDTYGGTIVIKDNSTISLVSGNPDPIVCEGSAFATPIQYAISPTTSTLVMAPTIPGVTFDPTTGIISGVPSQSGVYNYTISSSEGCSNVLSGVITVTSDQDISFISNNPTQTACQNSPIDPVVFSVSPGVNDVTITPSLPAGLGYSVNLGIVTISGTPTNAMGVSQNYIVRTVGSCGVAASESFTLDILQEAMITVTSDVSTINQSICQSGNIEPITFTIGGGATGIEPLDLPDNLVLNFDAGTGIYTVSGAPATFGTFNFNVVTTGCVASQLFSITNINTNISIELTSAVGTDDQQLCQSNFNTPITPIVYQLTGVTGVTVTGLPLGISSNFDNATGELVISGTPIDSGEFNYAITTLPCERVKTGVIKVSTPIAFFDEQVTQVSCHGENDGSISIDIRGGASAAGLYAISWTGPNGFQQNQATITGLEPGVYTITGTDLLGCAIPTKSYVIDNVEPVEISLLSTSNVTCEGSLGCANFDFTGGTGIYTNFSLEYLDPSSETLTPVTVANNNYLNICGLRAGLYYLTIEDSNSCKSSPYLFTIFDYSSLNIENVELDDSLCADNPGNIRVKVTSLDPNLTFYYNDVLVPHIPLGDSTYELAINNPTASSGVLKVKNDQECWNSINISTQIEMPDFDYTSLNFSTHNFIDVNESIEFTNTVDLSDIPAEYEYIVWDFGDNSPFKVFFNPDDLVPNSEGDSFKTVFHSYTIDGVYTVTLSVFNRLGCSQSVSQTITVGRGANIMAPSAFSPNDDGINDLFRASLIGFTKVSMYVYDPWGNVVYEITSDVDALDPNWGWNGVEKGNNEPKNGNYKYYVIATTIDGKVVEKTGQLMLIK